MLKLARFLRFVFRVLRVIAWLEHRTNPVNVWKFVLRVILRYDDLWSLVFRSDHADREKPKLTESDMIALTRLQMRCEKIKKSLGVEK